MNDELLARIDEMSDTMHSCDRLYVLLRDCRAALAERIPRKRDAKPTKRVLHALADNSCYFMPADRERLAKMWRAGCAAAIAGDVESDVRAAIQKG